MYFNILSVKGKPLTRYSFPMHAVVNLSDDGQKLSKHVVDDN